MLLVSKTIHLNSYIFQQNLGGCLTPQREVQMTWKEPRGMCYGQLGYPNLENSHYKLASSKSSEVGT